ncbi:hypothetical protein niasHT_014042 [Heterodera trifolii]|uniref:Uncharacterized protein n=1 Tax=Heterodera trifolii TaxID=157864 RepID=A0ABD2LG42_9BILA
MDDANIAAILAFYNLLAARIGLEDCQSLKEVRNLMPILANYMKSGTLTFIDDPNFGFRNAIDIIAHGLDEEFHSHLRPEAAESGDLSEATKIHLAMLYTFRLLQTEAFSTICERLEDKHQRHFATVIECLDDRRCWTFAPWPKLLHNDIKEEDKENGERRRHSSLNFVQTPKFNSARKSFFPSGNSPILKVVTSSRGEEVVRIHALEREVKALRQIRDVFGREKDKAEELCQQKERENNNLLKNIERLQAQIVPNAERVQLLEDQVHAMESQNTNMARQLQDAESRAANAQESVLTLQFELDEADIKQQQLEKLVEEQSVMIRMSQDESNTVEQLRKETRKLEDQVGQYKAKVRELRSKMKVQEEEFNRRYNEKVEEMALLQVELQQLKLGNEAKTAVQGNSLFAEVIDGKSKLEEQLSILHTDNGTLRRENERLKKMVDEKDKLLVLHNGKELTGPTLAVLFAVKNELEELLSEKKSLLERLHIVEELERTHAKQWAKERPAEYNIFQENLHTMNMHAKQQLEKRLLKKELSEKELVNALSFEKQRSESVPLLEQRVRILERELARFDGSSTRGLCNNL